LTDSFREVLIFYFAGVAAGFAANLVSRFEIYFAIKIQSSAFAPRFQNPLEAAKRRPKITRRFNAGYLSAHYESHRDGRTNVTKFPPYPSILSGKPLSSLRDSDFSTTCPAFQRRLFSVRLSETVGAGLIY
jgi:hypothetical protein